MREKSHPSYMLSQINERADAISVGDTVDVDAAFAVDTPGKIVTVAAVADAPRPEGGTRIVIL